MNPKNLKGFGPVGTNGAQAAPKAEPVDDGGPAFPGPYYSDGMKLRDYFAGQAMAGMLACPGFLNDLIKAYGCESKEDAHYVLSHLSYKQSDAMIAERKKAGR